MSTPARKSRNVAIGASLLHMVSLRVASRCQCSTLARVSAGDRGLWACRGRNSHPGLKRVRLSGRRLPTRQVRQLCGHLQGRILGRAGGGGVIRVCPSVILPSGRGGCHRASPLSAGVCHIFLKFDQISAAGADAREAAG
ncbi:hypothetical protein GGTG_12285 [Gaeumannomyces tritici R3-111a-1]|uniref:Uncharacterized protein n=1 Tax=Gaeumannomyces tritici (strain R3-111a-1) TaxID=644352 RepID=J3PFL0_GAET3|nr:hypothetical protein GGTG_12285 [Gaeumannomyces tritici R3-111a-1]EJT70112.1 hypothetical protein GGTG_12285 [Gaeumannomyces tritici R3-111a-1]